MNYQYVQIQAALTKEHLLILEFCKEMFVNEAADGAKSKKHSKRSAGYTKVDERVQYFTSVRNTGEITERNWQHQKRTSSQAETRRGRSRRGGTGGTQYCKTNILTIDKMGKELGKIVENGRCFLYYNVNFQFH